MNNTPEEFLSAIEVQSLNDARAAMLVLADQRQRAIDDVKALQEELAEYEHVNQLLNRDNKSWRKDNKALREALEFYADHLTYTQPYRGYGEDNDTRSIIQIDNGTRARKALKPHTGGK